MAAMGPGEERYQAYKANPTMTVEALAALVGCSPAAFHKTMSRDGFKARLARELLGPVAPVDPTTHAVATVEAFLSGLTAEDMKAVDIDRILAGVRELRAGTVTAKAIPWPVPANVDLLRGLLSDLPPMDPECPFDVRRLSHAQRESLCWLFDRAMGNPAPWRQANEEKPGSPEVAEPPFDLINGEKS